MIEDEDLLLDIIDLSRYADKSQKSWTGSVGESSERMVGHASRLRI